MLIRLRSTASPTASWLGLVVAGSTVVALTTLLPVRLAAQKFPPPANVTVQGTGTSVTVSWAPVPFKGLTYRVLRALDAKAPGIDLIKPANVASVVDPNVAPGSTYFYQVVAVDGKGTMAAAAPVQFTVPNAALAPVTGLRGLGLKGQPVPLGIAPGSRGLKTPVLTPTAVTGITVNGTLASATVSWQPVTGAASYSVKRTAPPGYYGSGSSGAITTTTWSDAAPLGFVFPGVYLYEVTADLGGGTSVSGRANWTRPDPTCAAPPANQPMLAVLDTKASPNGGFVSYGPFPNGAVLTWVNLYGVVAYRIERSTQGTNTWTLVGTSCGATPSIAGSWGIGSSMRFIDGTPGIVPNTAYVYRLTTLAANGEAGMSTIPWTAPNAPVLHWLSATVAGKTATLTFRYEPPVTNPPAPPIGYHVTAPYGLSQTPHGSCAALAGCSLVINAVPSGTHQFRMTAEWTIRPQTGSAGVLVWHALFATASAETTVTVP